MNIGPAEKDLIWGIGIMSTLIATGASAVFQLLNGWRERVATDRRHLREQAIRIAIEQWQHEATMEAQRSTVTAGASTAILYKGPPARDLHEVVFRALQFTDAFSKHNVTDANLTRFLSKATRDEGK
jgi:hypothetical protein